MPPTRQQMREPTSDRQDAACLDAGTTTGSAGTNNPDGVRAARPCPADTHPVVRSRRSEGEVASVGRTSWRHRHPMQHLGTEYVSRPAMGLWSSSGAAPHSMASTKICTSYGQSPFCPCANQVHPELGLVTQIGGLVQLSFRRSNDSTRAVTQSG
jgi:hypothetical protein